MKAIKFILSYLAFGLGLILLFCEADNALLLIVTKIIGCLIIYASGEFIMKVLEKIAKIEKIYKIQK
jgi:hypothetical protein